MGRIKDLKYTITTAKQMKDLRKASGDTPWGALAETLVWANNFFLEDAGKKELDRKLETMYNDIFKAMSDFTGVLVVVQFQQFRVPYPTKHNPPQLLSIFIGPGASNRQSAYRKWKHIQSQGVIKQAPDKGMVYGPTACLWFTRGLSKHDLQQSNESEKEYWKSSP